MLRSFVVALSLVVATGCATRPPVQSDDVCSIFADNPRWHRAALRAESEWGVSIGHNMAIVFQESSFKHDAKAPKKRVFFGMIPWGRTSTAYGYPQALNQTWSNYRKATGKHRAQRTDFADAMDFIGWYSFHSHDRNGVPLSDTYNQYLNYHEGWGGYSRQTYMGKPWLLRVARKVQTRANMYNDQYARCEQHLQPGFWKRLLSVG